jgi:hypothetical protein
VCVHHLHGYAPSNAIFSEKESNCNPHSTCVRLVPVAMFICHLRYDSEHINPVSVLVSAQELKRAFAFATELAEAVGDPRHLANIRSLGNRYENCSQHCH